MTRRKSPRGGSTRLNSPRSHSTGGVGQGGTPAASLTVLDPWLGKEWDRWVARRSLASPALSEPDVLVDMPCSVRTHVYPTHGTQARRTGSKRKHTDATYSHTCATRAHPIHNKQPYSHTHNTRAHTCAQALRRRELSLGSTENVVDVLLTLNHSTNTQPHIIVVLLEAF